MNRCQPGIATASAIATVFLKVVEEGSDKGVQEICSRAVDQGSQAVKIKVGYPSLREDLDRIDTFVRQWVWIFS